MGITGRIKTSMHKNLTNLLSYHTNISRCCDTYLLSGVVVSQQGLFLFYGVSLKKSCSVTVLFFKKLIRFLNVVEFFVLMISCMIQSHKAVQLGSSTKNTFYFLFEFLVLENCSLSQ